MFLPGVFAELERQRHVELAKSFRLELIARAYGIADGADLSEDAEADRGNDYLLDKWIKTHELRIQLEQWKGQLLKMIAHVDELGETVFGGEADDKLREIGSRINLRLREIVDDYEYEIRLCTMSIDGLNLATQLVRSV